MYNFTIQYDLYDTYTVRNKTMIPLVRYCIIRFMSTYDTPIQYETFTHNTIPLVRY